MGKTQLQEAEKVVGEEQYRDGLMCKERQLCP